MDCRVGVPIEGKGKHLLAKTTLPRVSGAGRRVKQLWDSEENVKKTELNRLAKGFITYMKSVVYFWDIHIV